MKSGTLQCRLWHTIQLLLLMACCLPSQVANAQRYPFHNLNVDDGLVQSQATCLAQDKTGNLWIGTLGGLSRYDGKNFTNYTVRNGLLSNTVWAVAIDDHQDVWIGGPSGISRFNGRTFAHYTKPQQLTRSINNTQQIQIVHDTVWWRAQGDVYCIAKGNISYFNSPDEHGLVSSILAESNGIWVAKEGIIYHNIASHWDTIKVSDPQQALPLIYRIFRDRDSTVWVTTSTGLYKVAGYKMEPYAGSGGAHIRSAIFSVAQDKADALWLATGSGVIKVDSGLQYYNKHNGLRDNSFLDMFTDVRGNVWMASDGQGVFRFSGTQFTGLDETMGLPSAQITAIAASRGDSLFLGTYDAGLYIYHDGHITPFPFPANLAPAVTALYYARNGTLWIGTRGGGLWTYQNKVLKRYDAYTHRFPSDFINSLHEDESGRLWIGFANGAAIASKDSFTLLPVHNMPVVSFLPLGKDSMLIATGKKNGILLYHAGNISDLRTNTLLDSSTVQCFILQGRELWAGSSDNGVLRYNLDSHQLFAVNENNGLRSDFIYNIIADDEGNIWTGTGFGIHRIRTKKVQGREEAEVAFYGKAQGITGMESNINTVLKLGDGSIWFGTTNGALHYRPHTSVVSATPTSIILQSVKITGENGIQPGWSDSLDNWYGIPYHLRLPPKKNNISFTFQAITLSGAQQLLYRYRMDGLEAPWTDWSATNSVTFSTLPPGKYVFHVQCRGADGVSNPELSYPFEIITPFQKTKWFRILVLLACILTGILLQYIANNMKQRRQRLLSRLRAEEQSKIRMRTAEDFHDEIGNKLTRINVLTNVLKNKITPTPDTLRILGQIEDNAAQLYSGTRDILWSLKPSNDTLYEILVRISDFGSELFQDTEVSFSFTGINEKWVEYRLPIDMSRNLIMIFKEALNNALKYSGAKNVTVHAEMTGKHLLQLMLKDDGAGFDTAVVRKGNGISNMNVRAARMNGNIAVQSVQGGGTTITLTFKIPPNR